jgi:hypothetical protein
LAYQLIAQLNRRSSQSDIIITNDIFNDLSQFHWANL